jgi:hypothetical protein
MQYFGLKYTLIIAAAWWNQDTSGKITVGTQIISEKEARGVKSEYLLVVLWHIIEKFKQRKKEFLRCGGKFILPASHFTLIKGSSRV